MASLSTSLALSAHASQPSPPPSVACRRSKRRLVWSSSRALALSDLSARAGALARLLRGRLVLTGGARWYLVLLLASAQGLPGEELYALEPAEELLQKEIRLEHLLRGPRR